MAEGMDKGVIVVERVLSGKLLEMASKYPVVSVTGPRQSGKSTLLRSLFSSYRYVSFENPDVRSFFEDDPRAFLEAYGGQVIFDEVQRVPALFSYLQQIVDEHDLPGQFVLSGSQNFLLMKSISQSLAGRVAVLKLLPFSYEEMQHGGVEPEDAFAWVCKGAYPRIYDKSIDPADYYPNYIQTYIERDVRGELGVVKLADFERFLALCALRSGELLNMTGLASDCGISVATARSWLSMLEASYVLFTLRPYHANQGKRMVKTPKLYFYDSGLACNLLGIEDAGDLLMHPQKGALFETAVIGEVVKRFYAQGRTPRLSFWRDSNKREIDLLVEKGALPYKAVEIKSSTTYNSRYFDAVDRIAEDELGLAVSACSVVYAGSGSMVTSRGNLVSFKDVSSAIGI